VVIRWCIFTKGCLTCSCELTENSRVGGSSPSLATIPNAKASPETVGLSSVLTWKDSLPLYVFRCASQPRERWLLMFCQPGLPECGVHTSYTGGTSWGCFVE